jgi:hypothetical protein
MGRTGVVRKRMGLKHKNNGLPTPKRFWQSTMRQQLRIIFQSASSGTHLK